MILGDTNLGDTMKNFDEVDEKSIRKMKVFIFKEDKRSLFIRLVFIKYFKYFNKTT